jgi:hypothetical protein
MAYDSKYQHGLSHLNHGEDEPCSPKILKALYAAVYDADASEDVVQLLLRAYDIQHGIDHDDAPEPKVLQGEEAWRFMYKCWLPVFKHECDRYEIAYDDRGIENSETFEWPSALPFDYPIRTGILKSIGERMGRSDAWLTKCLRDEFKKRSAA